MGASRINLLLSSIVWVTIGMEAVVPISAAVSILIAIAAALYIVFQCLKASFAKNYNNESAALILHRTLSYNC